MTEIRSGRSLFEGHRGGAFGRLQEFDPGLIVDAGAAGGWVAIKALSYAKASSHVLGFEPFPGNWPIAEKTFENAPAKLVRAALGREPGQAQFFVESTTTTKGVSGYSSIGYVINRKDPFAFAKHALRRLRSPKGQVYTVPVTTIDEHVSERILFLKMDVQGSELAVLNGARNAFDRGIDTLQIEFDGDADVLKFLAERDYVIFDTQYVLRPRFKKPDLTDWDVASEAKLTTGHKIYYAWPKQTPADPEDFCQFFGKQFWRVGSVWTDIFAVRRNLAAERGWL